MITQNDIIYALNLDRNSGVSDMRLLLNPDTPIGNPSAINVIYKGILPERPYTDKITFLYERIDEPGVLKYAVIHSDNRCNVLLIQIPIDQEIILYGQYIYDVNRNNRESFMTLGFTTSEEVYQNFTFQTDFEKIIQDVYQPFVCGCKPREHHFWFDDILKQAN